MMKLGIIRLYVGESGKVGYYNIQEIGLAKSLAKKGIYTDIFFNESKITVFEAFPLVNRHFPNLPFS